MRAFSREAQTRPQRDGGEFGLYIVKLFGAFFSLSFLNTVIYATSYGIIIIIIMRFGTLLSSLYRIIIISDFGTEMVNITPTFLFTPLVYEDLKEALFEKEKMTSKEKIW